MPADRRCRAGRRQVVSPFAPEAGGGFPATSAPFHDGERLPIMSNALSTGPFPTQTAGRSFATLYPETGWRPHDQSGATLATGRRRPELRQVPLERRGSREAGRTGSPRLSIQPTRRGPHPHQHRGRQHLVQARGEGSPHGRGRRGAVGQGLGRRPAHGPARRLRVALPGQAARDEDALPRPPRARTEDGHRRRDGPDVLPLRLQPQPARVLHRHSPPHLRPPP